MTIPIIIFVLIVAAIAAFLKRRRTWSADELQQDRHL